MKVFWPNVIISIVVFFITIEASKLDFLFFGSFSSIDTNGQDLFLPPLSLFPPVFLKSLFFILFLSQLCRVVTWQGGYGFSGLDSLE